MRTRPDDTHLAAQHIPELRDLIDAKLPEKTSQRINSIVVIARLMRDSLFIQSHRAKFVNDEPAVLNSGAHLFVEKRARRLEPLRDPNQDGGERENQRED